MSNSSSNWATIIVAIIGAIAVIIAALLAYEGSQRRATVIAIEATMTAEAKLAFSTSMELGQSPAATSTPVPATSTSVPLTTASGPVVTDTSTTTPTETSIPTAIPTITPIPPDNTSPGTILEVGQTWKQKGVELTLTGFAYDTHYLRVDWLLKNNTNQDLFMKYDFGNFSAKNNLGTQLKVERFGYPGYLYSGVETILKPGQSIINSDPSCKAGLAIEIDFENKQQNEVVIAVSNMSRIEKAQWRVPVSLN